MDPASRLTTIELDPTVQAIAQEQLGNDPRVAFASGYGGAWLEDFDGTPFDLVFADTWPDKFTHLDRALDLVVTGGTCLIDDLAWAERTAGWRCGRPEAHEPTPITSSPPSIPRRPSSGTRASARSASRPRIESGSVSRVGP
jgi:hypothetical protein